MDIDLNMFQLQFIKMQLRYKWSTLKCILILTVLSTLKQVEYSQMYSYINGT